MRTIGEPWRDQAACLGRVDRDSDPWFPVPEDGTESYATVRGSDATYAISICKRCPVRAECLDAAMKTEKRQSKFARFGIYGGLTPRQRWDRSRNIERKSA